jgi:thiamine biosynthesis lipoprotein ApbE
MRQKTSVLVAILLLLRFAASSSAAATEGSAQVYLTKEQALQAVFPECREVLEIQHRLTSAERVAVSERLGRTVKDPGFLVYLGVRDGRLDGYAVISAEVGKFKPITYIVGVEPGGAVRRVAVLVYRENHGAEVRSRRFLRQYQGKSLADPVRLHRDIINISGATMSATALCRGTRKVLAFLQEVYQGPAPLQLLEQARTAGARSLWLKSAPVSRADSTRSRRVEAERLVMGSSLRVVALGQQQKLFPIVQKALDEAERLDRVLSNYSKDSELSRLNRQPVGEWLAVGSDLLRFLKVSRQLHQTTGGAYDPTVGRLLDAYGLTGGTPRQPEAEELAELCRNAGMDALEVDDTTAAARILRSGVQLDPGAMGKGMAVDRVVEILRSGGVTNAWVDFGSTQRALGEGPEGRGWPVQIRDPLDPSRAVEELWLRDQALSTSGGYEKFKVINGERVAHILDPRTGLPCKLSLSASVVAASATQADALSTALFVLGPEAGLRLIRSLDDVDGFLVPRSAGPERVSVCSTDRRPAHSSG